MPRILAHHSLFSARQRKNKWAPLAGSGSSTNSTASSSFGSTDSSGSSNNDLLCHHHAKAIVGEHLCGMDLYKAANDVDGKTTATEAPAAVTAPPQFFSFGEDDDDLEDWGYFVELATPKDARTSFERKRTYFVNDRRE
jgi:hypothetical protein